MQAPIALKLIKVLSHYEGDSLKYKATHFLIDNMIHHYSFTSERLRKYYKIITRHLYALFYFAQNDPCFLGQKVAAGDVLTYDSIPSKVLYLLKDLTKKEEQIFTYEGGKQIWW